MWFIFQIIYELGLFRTLATCINYLVPSPLEKHLTIDSYSYGREYAQETCT